MDVSKFYDGNFNNRPPCVQPQSEGYSSQECSKNRFVYVKQTRVSEFPQSASQQILVNPHFRKKVYINPKFNSSNSLTGKTTSIHVNPQMYNLKSSDTTTRPSQKNYTNSPVPKVPSLNIHINPSAGQLELPTTVHINPKFKDNLAINLKPATESNISKVVNETVLLTKTKLVRVPAVAHCRKRRNSVKSKYKIVKSKPIIISPKRVSVLSKASYKVDNRTKKSPLKLGPKKKYAYSTDSKSLHLSYRANTFKHLYPLRSPNKTSILKSKYKFVRKVLSPKQQANNKNELIKIAKKRSVSEKSFIVKTFKLVRKHPTKVVKSPKKMKKCNIPCPFYRKYGICRGKESGKCFKKHDPDQIALCTKFLQGACIKEKCLLSHKVSQEKVPTCKYYLEGVCSKENCPYLHVKISPKADICRDFIEGFCEKAAECHKRHQYLCPDYEKHGKCPKQRCPYPHGKMVRHYLVNKNKFAKNCSELKIKPTQSAIKRSDDVIVEKPRYYIDDISKRQANEIKTFESMDIRSRAKLGTLPSFIPLEEL